MVQTQEIGTGSKYGLEILLQREKGLKVKVRKFFRLIPTFLEVTGGKLVEGRVFWSPILNRVKIEGQSFLQRKNCGFQEVITESVILRRHFVIYSANPLRIALKKSD